MKQTDINNQYTMSHSKDKRKGYYNYYLRTLIKGFVVTLPFVILLFLLSLGFKLVFNMLSPLNGLLHTKATEPHWSLNILSLFVLLGFFSLWVCFFETGLEKIILPILRMNSFLIFPYTLRFAI